MARKTWSNLFLLLAAINLALALFPGNPVRVVDWIALPFCVTLSAMARRRMV